MASPTPANRLSQDRLRLIGWMFPARAFRRSLCPSLRRFRGRAAIQENKPSDRRCRWVRGNAEAREAAMRHQPLSAKSSQLEGGARTRALDGHRLVTCVQHTRSNRSAARSPSAADERCSELSGNDPDKTVRRRFCETRWLVGSDGPEARLVAFPLTEPAAGRIPIGLRLPAALQPAVTIEPMTSQRRGWNPATALRAAKTRKVVIGIGTIGKPGLVQPRRPMRGG